MSRIVHVVRYGSVRGGAETYVAALAEGLRAHGDEVRLVYGLDPDPRREEVAEGRHVPGLVDGSRDVAGLEAALRALAPDVIHLHLLDEPWTLEVCRAVAPTLLASHDHRIGCPTGTRYHTAWKNKCDVTPGLRCLGYNVAGHCGSLRANLTLRPYRSWREISNIVRDSGLPVQVFSEHMADRYEPLLGRRPHVTPYPAPSGIRERRPSSSGSDDVPLAPMPGEASRTRAEMDRRPVVFASGRLNREKGFRELIDVLTHVHVPIHLVIAGDGHDRDAVERRASQATGGHRVTFTGWLDTHERNRWLARASIVAVPSMWPEPFGIVGLEAMSAGKPVVAFDSGGISEWLADGRTGILVPHGDIARFGAAIERLLQDPAQAEAMGAAGRARAEEEFRLDLHVQRVLDLYRLVAR